MKELLLKEEAGNANVGHREIAIAEGRWRHHVPPEPAQVDIFHTPDRPPPAPAPEPLRVPVGQPVAFMPDHPEIGISSTRSRGSRKARNRNQPGIPPEDPIIQEAEYYNINTPLNTPRSKQRGRINKHDIVYDVDPHVEDAHEIAIDDEDMRQQRQEELRERSVAMARMINEAAQNTGIEALMGSQGGKRREEGTKPKPAKPKARHTKPKREADEEPEGQREPKGKPGRPRNTPASASTDVPSQLKAPEKSPEPKKSPGRPKKEEAPKEPKSKPIPVKKTTKQTEQVGVEKVSYDSYSEWKSNSNKASLVNQYSLRKGIGPYLTTKADMKGITPKQLIEKIMEFDKKHKK